MMKQFAIITDVYFIFIASEPNPDFQSAINLLVSYHLSVRVSGIHACRHMPTIIMQFIFNLFLLLGMTDNSKISKISKPIQLRSYMTVADFKGKKFAFRKDMIVQVLQKDPTGN